MKKRNILQIIVFLVVVLFTACEKDADDHTYGGDPLVAFESTNSSISEVDTSNTIRIAVFMAKSSEIAGTINFEFDTVGIANPAVENVNFSLVNTSKTLSFAADQYYAYIELKPIDNDLYEGNKTVNIILSSPSSGIILGYNGGEDNIEFAMTFIDNEHPLANWIGSYTVDAASQGSPGAWDESWNVTTSPYDGDETILVITGIAGSTLGVISTLDLVAMTITIEAGQVMTDYSYGNYGPLGIYSGTYAGGVVAGQALTGTINNDGTIIVNNWVHQFTDDGPNAGVMWDAFDCTFNLNK